MFKSTKVMQGYEKFLKNPTNNYCRFCKPKKSDIEKIYKHWWVFNLIAPYEMWDELKVTDHLMVVPKKHYTAVGEAKVEEFIELQSIFLEFEKQNYNIYWRAQDSCKKSVEHLHIHLIKTDNNEKLKKMSFKLNPYEVKYQW